MATVEPIGERLNLGEGPHWDVDSQSLYFVDITGKTIYKYVPESKQCTKATVGNNPVGFIVPVEGKKDTFIVGLSRSLSTIVWDGVSEQVSKIEKLAEVDTDEESNGNRINDGKADPSGRVWFGTMGPKLGSGKYLLKKSSLYSYGKGEGVKVQLSGISISNGLAWNTELKKLYYIDSAERAVFQFDFDVERGVINNREVIFDFKEVNIPGAPDGLTIDTDGNLWVAVFGGSRVIQIDPRRPNTLLRTIELPATRITSVTFGGPNLDEMYVTSSKLPTNEKSGIDKGGFTFKLTGLGVKGYPGIKAKL